MDTHLMSNNARSSAIAGVLAATVYLVFSAVMRGGLTGEVFTAAIIIGLVTLAISFVISSVVSLLKVRR
jgi:hypothetical protein